MQYSQLIEDIIKDVPFSVNTTRPLYVERLLPDLDDQAFIIFHKNKVPNLGQVTKISIEGSEQADPDVTGSPLEYSFGRDSFNESVINPRRYWSQEEEYHLPINVQDARESINLCLEYAKSNWNVSILAVCDQKDKQNTVLLGTSIETDCHKTILVCVQEPKVISEITPDCSDILKEHLKMSSVKSHEVKVNVFCSYELFGTKEAFTNWGEIPKSSFEGYLSLELMWNSLSFYPPMRQSTKTLVMEIAAGWKGSPLNHLWEEILLLNRYLLILEEYLEKNLSSRYSVMPLQFPSNFCHPSVKSGDEVIENLSCLLSGDDAFLKNTDANSKMTSNDDNVENDVNLKQHLQDLSTRQNLDFTDYLWMILKGCVDHAQVTDCVHTVFDEIEKKDYKPQMNVSNSTRLAKLISDIQQQKATAPLLAGSLPLEILVDIGIEKLNRDYAYLLLSANLVERHELQQKLGGFLSGELDIEKYRKNLLTLAQIHICLEFALLVQTHLDYPSESLQSLFGCALQKFTSEESPVKSFKYLEENCILNLRVPIPNTLIKHVIEGSPSSWYIRLSSNIGITQLTTGTFYSLTPIFPPNIHYEEETSKNEETYYAASIISSAFKIK